MKANLKSQSGGGGTLMIGPAMVSGHSSKMPKTLTEHKSKRLSILTSINEHKHILFTKKAFKHEKEKIWRQIFTKMLDFGMVSKEKDWRYVRDVSFSNWRKRAQKRLKHLAANGYRLNMDECEFLIYDILGKTPDKVMGGGEEDGDLSLSGNFSGSGAGGESTVGGGGGWSMMTVEGSAGGVHHPMMMMKMGHRVCGDEDDDESDEYMIDSDEDDEEDEGEGDEDEEEDEDDADFDERLFVPKIVFNDGGSCNNQQMINNHETLQGTSSNNNSNCNNNGQRKSSNTASGEGCSSEKSTGILKQELMNKGKSSNSSSNGVLQRLLFNGNNHQQHHHQQHHQRQFGKFHQNMSVSSTNNHQNHHRQNHHQSLHNNKHRSVGKLALPQAPPTPIQTPSSATPSSSSVTFANNVNDSTDPTLPELDLDIGTSSPNVRYVNKFRELRLLDLEIENKVLKNRYMKLKIFQLEDRLGVEHCKEVKEFKVEVGGAETGEGAPENGPSSPSSAQSQSTKSAANEQTTASNGEQLNLNHKANNVGGPSANKKART